MPVFSPAEVALHLRALPDWKIEAGELARTFLFVDFRGAISFVNRVAEAAEEAEHHPDIDIRYNRIRLGLATHDAGGLTAKDFDLAACIDKLL